VSQLRRGYLYGFAAYILWGFFPIYFKLLKPAGAVEILAHRVVWSVAFVGLLLAVARRWSVLSGLLRRPGTPAGVLLAAVLIAINWGVYIWGVNIGRVVETSLGYFINPLVTVLFGVILLGERLRRAQWAALGLGLMAVVVLTVDYGRPPYLALILALTFAGYGLVKKRLGLPAAEGLLVESGVLALPALAFLAWLAWQGTAQFGQVSIPHTLLLMLSGLVTAVPLLLFAGATNRIPLTGLGILQYVAPVLQLGCGVLIFNEPMPPTRLAGFAIVWLALLVFTLDGIRHARHSARRRRESAGAPRADVTPTPVGSR
jgi:chloramphenicol-sensitive protein RarD